MYNDYSGKKFSWNLTTNLGIMHLEFSNGAPASIGFINKKSKRVQFDISKIDPENIIGSLEKIYNHK